MNPEEHGSRWTHAICTVCWDIAHPDRRPVQVREHDAETCCFCGEETDAGIFTRQDPKTVPCMEPEG